MKNHILTVAAIFTLGTFLFTGCNKEDTTPPVITLLGDNPFEIQLGTPFNSINDPGAEAEDNEDGDLTASIVPDYSDVDKDKVGSYTVQYSVADAAGNITDEYREVNVINGSPTSAWTGNYSCVITDITGGTYAYSEALAISTTLNNGLEWSKFGDYGNASGKVNIKVTGTSVTLPIQTITCGSPTAVARQFEGSGTTTGTGSAGDKITITVTETVNGIPANFTYVYTKQ